jgi:hypothetical protein
MTPDGKQPLGVRYMQLTAVLVSAIQGLAVLFALLLAGFGFTIWKMRARV